MNLKFYAILISVHVITLAQAKISESSATIGTSKYTQPQTGIAVKTLVRRGQCASKKSCPPEPPRQSPPGRAADIARLKNDPSSKPTRTLSAEVLSSSRGWTSSPGGNPQASSNKKQQPNRKDGNSSNKYPDQSRGSTGSADDRARSLKVDHAKAEVEIWRARRQYMDGRKALENEWHAHNEAFRSMPEDQQSKERLKERLGRHELIKKMDTLFPAKDMHIDAVRKAKTAAELANETTRATRLGKKLDVVQAHSKLVRTRQVAYDARNQHDISKDQADHLILSKGPDHAETQAAQRLQDENSQIYLKKERKLTRAHQRHDEAKRILGYESDSSDEARWRTQANWRP